METKLAIRMCIYCYRGVKVPTIDDPILLGQGNSSPNRIRVLSNIYINRGAYFMYGCLIMSNENKYEDLERLVRKKLEKL